MDNHDNRTDPYGILSPGNIGPFASVCETCGCRKAGALGHGPPCGCGASHPSAVEVMLATLAGVDPAKLVSAPPSSKARLLVNCEGDTFVGEAFQGRSSGPITSQAFVETWLPTTKDESAALEAWEALMARFRNWNSRIGGGKFSETATCWLPSVRLDDAPLPTAILHAEFLAYGDKELGDRPGLVAPSHLQGRLDAAILVASTKRPIGVKVEVVFERLTYLVVKVSGQDAKAVGDQAVVLSDLFMQDETLRVAHERIG